MNAAVEAAPLRSRERTFDRARLSSWMSRGIELLRNLGPYALIEILLPGGTLMALLLWLYRKRRKLTRPAGACADCAA